MIIASKSYINESEQGAKLLRQWPIDTLSINKKVSVAELKLQKRLRKVVIVEEPTIVEIVVDWTIAIEQIKSHIRPTERENLEQAMLVTEFVSKIYEPKTYNEVVTDPIYDQCWKKIVEKELQNLENHQT